MKTDYAFGGSAAADASACIDSWPRVLAFLEDAAGRAASGSDGTSTRKDKIA